MNNKKKDYWEIAKNVGAVLLVLTFFGAMMVTAFRPAQHDTFTINLTGDKDIRLTNDSVVYIVYDCIKHCNDKFYASDYKLEGCYEQCQKLGELI